MARKPNYNYERMERDKAKAAKKAARLKARTERQEQRKSEQAEQPTVLEQSAIPEQPATEE